MDLSTTLTNIIVIQIVIQSTIKKTQFDNPLLVFTVTMSKSHNKPTKDSHVGKR